MITKRLEYMDVLRALACFLVVLTHSALPSETGTDGIWKYLISFIASPATQVFFAISGALLIKPNIETGTFLKKRFLRLLPPVVVWSLITMVVYVLLGKKSLDEALWSVAWMPFQPVIGIYWFVYVIIGLYFLTPVLSAFVAKASKRSIEFYLLLWCITLLLPYLNIAELPCWMKYQSDGSYYHPLIYFGGYAGYFLLGYYLKNYPIAIGWNRRFVALAGGFLFVNGGGKIILHIWGLDSGLDDYLQIGQLLFTALLFTLAQHLPQRILQWTVWKQISIYSFGIYLMHPIVVRDLVWRFFEQHRMHALVETPVIALVSIALCYTLLWMLSRLPKTKWLTGV